jgi:hypothetical protein
VVKIGKLLCCASTAKSPDILFLTAEKGCLVKEVHGTHPTIDQLTAAGIKIRILDPEPELQLSALQTSQRKIGRIHGLPVTNGRLHTKRLPSRLLDHPLLPKTCTLLPKTGSNHKPVHLLRIPEAKFKGTKSKINVTHP